MLTHTAPGRVEPTRVVILGGSGFVGANLASHLQTLAVPTLSLSSRDLDLTAKDAGQTVADLLQPTDALVFVSALTPDKGRDIGTMMSNLAMAEHVCGAIAAGSCAHGIYVSSDAVYDDTAETVSERSCASPSGYHGLMHLVRERMLSATFAAAGIPLALLRPSLLYGAGDTHNGYGPNRFVRSARAQGAITIFGEGEERRDHVFINDVSRIIEQVLRGRSAGVLNIATGVSQSFGDVARLVAQRFPGTSIESRPRTGAIMHRSFDVTAARAAFPGFSFTTLEEGLARA